jgi:15-cis-phytoene synthase
MRIDADLSACAALVQKGDPDRFMAAMAAPVAARVALLPIYALNVEVARVPWVTHEGLIAEIRLQWWRDGLAEIAAGTTSAPHEVLTPLARVVTARQAGELGELIAVRRWDIYKEPFDNPAHFTRYIDQSAGTLMWVAARALGPADEGVVRDYAYASGLANWLRAVPHLQERGRVPLLDASPEAIRDLARGGLERLARARQNRALVSKAASAALLVGWQAQTVLKQVLVDPERVAAGTLGQSEVGRRAALMYRVVTGRW